MIRLIATAPTSVRQGEVYRQLRGPDETTRARDDPAKGRSVATHRQLFGAVSIPAEGDTTSFMFRSRTEGKLLASKTYVSSARKDYT